MISGLFAEGWPTGAMVLVLVHTLEGGQTGLSYRKVRFRGVFMSHDGVIKDFNFENGTGANDVGCGGVVGLAGGGR